MSPAITRQRQQNVDDIVILMHEWLSQREPEAVLSIALALTRQFANALTVKRQAEWLSQLREFVATHSGADDSSGKEGGK